MRLTTNGKPFAPKAGAVGSELTFSLDGREITAQVWSLAPAIPIRRKGRVPAVWAVADGVAYLVDKYGTVHDQYGRRAEVAA